MPRVKRGFKARQRRNKVLKAAKGYRGGAEQALQDGIHFREQSENVCISGSESQEKGISKTVDFTDQCGSPREWTLIQQVNGRAQ